MFSRKRNIAEEFKVIKEIGEGSYGVVLKALYKKNNEIVAIKKIKCEDRKYGITLSALRELKVLQEIKHENVIELKSVFLTPSNLNLVYEFIDTDLEQLIKNLAIDISASDIKSFMFQLLKGVEILHKSWVIHRDLKPANLLLSNGKPLKIGDFGLSKIIGDARINYSPQCVTRWYRAPELLFGARKYGFGVDIWSCGCIFAELLLRNPFFPGNSDLDQLGKIFAALGTPNNKKSMNNVAWPFVTKLPNFVQFEEFEGTQMSKMFSAASKEAIDLLSRMLVLCPTKRISASDALKHPYFRKGKKMTPVGAFKVKTKEGE